jgi:hypothetical protein
MTKRRIELIFCEDDYVFGKVGKEIFWFRPEEENKLHAAAYKEGLCIQDDDVVVSDHRRDESSFYKILCIIDAEV